MVSRPFINLLVAFAWMMISCLGVQAILFGPNDDFYKKYCVNNEAANFGYVCFDVNFDIQAHAADSSPGLVGVTSADKKHFVITVAEKEDVWFNTLGHNIVMHPIKKDGVVPGGHQVYQADHGPGSSHVTF
ncbi:uncharacterized protein UTRI_04989 [Ustilago trichophora]|uniref:Uncharacterized protein n=1 Tax=Ustilago trichophora TaxID=86804 RepID=A0A5C3EDY3_9BASI|nr:uncharacterized protein UTRI_04989 [Ustilago trichophora]